MYDVGVNYWVELKVYVDRLACVRVKGGESERFRIDCGLFNS